MKPRLTLKGQPDRRHLNPGRPATGTPPLVSQAVRLERATVEALRTRAASLGLTPAEAIRAAVAEWINGTERARCAAIARNYGPSRPPTSRGKEYEDRHLGECAASSGIAHLIENPAAVAEWLGPLS